MRLPRHLLFPLLLACLAAPPGLSACGDDEDNGSPDTAADTADSTGTDSTGTDTQQQDQDTVDPGKRDLHAPMMLAFTYRDPESPGDPVSMYALANEPGVDNLRQGGLFPISADIDCAGAQCIVTRDLGWFIMHLGTAELRVGPISPGPTIAQSALQFLASNVSQVEVAGTRLAYVSDNRAFYLDLAAGLTTPADLGEVVVQTGDGINYVGGGIAIAERGDSLLIHRFDLSSLAVFAVPLSGGAERLVYRFGMPRLSGSFFQAKNPFVVTADGQTAIMLLEGMTLHHTCETNVGCDDLAEATCAFFIDQGVQSATGLCNANQRSLQSFALGASDLGEACTSDADCDPRHRCTTEPASLTTGARTVCVPRQHILGPKGGSACTAVAEGQFPDIGRTLRITDDDRVLFLAINPCGTHNISDNAVVAIDADLAPASLAVVEGAYGKDFGQQYCYDQQENTWSYPDCAIEIQDFDLSPGGGLVLRASGPDDRIGRELWVFDEDGDKYPLTSDIFYDVGTFFATSR